MTITQFRTFEDGLEPHQRLRVEYQTNTDLDNDDLWIPYVENVWFQACHFNVTTGGFANVLKVLPGNQLPKHYHISTVHGFTLRGSWRYLEHDWVATPGSYIYEPAGEAHTLIVDAENTEPMMTFFVLAGGLIYCEEDGTFVGYDDGFTLLELARAHYSNMGFDQSILDGMLR